MAQFRTYPAKSGPAIRDYMAPRRGAPLGGVAVQAAVDESIIEVVRQQRRRLRSSQLLL